MTDWEVFLDVSYYDLWAVRPTGESRLGYTFHVMTKQEADALVLTLLTARNQGRDEGLEEAAKVANGVAGKSHTPHDRYRAMKIAAAIRAKIGEHGNG